MKFSTKGLILRQQNIGEQDRLVWVLSDTHGVFHAFARRARNIKSPKCAGTGLLVFSDLAVFQGRDSYSIDEASATEQFTGLRKDVESMALAQYFCELCLNLAPKEAPANEFLRLILNALYLLSTGKRSRRLVKFCFEMRLMSLCGYLPDLVMCPSCGAYEKDEMDFLFKTGKLICSDCIKTTGDSGIVLPLSAVRALRHSVYADFEKLFSFSLPDDQLDLLNLASESYVREMTSKEFLTLSLYKSLQRSES